MPLHLCCLLLGMGTPLRAVCSQVRLRLSGVSGNLSEVALGLGMGACALHLSALGTRLLQTCAGLCMLSTSLHRAHWALREEISWRHPIQYWVFQSVSLHIVWLWVSGLFPTCFKRKLLWWLNKILILITVIRCHYSAILGFSLGPWPVYSGYWPPKQLHVIEWALNAPYVCCSLLPQTFGHYCTRCRQVTIVGKRVCSWIGIYLSPLIASRLPPCHELAQRSEGSR